LDIHNEKGRDGVSYEASCSANCQCSKTSLARGMPCSKMCKANTTQFTAIVLGEKAHLGLYYDAFLSAPKYLLASGGPTRMRSIVEGVEGMLVCNHFIVTPLPTFFQQKVEYPNIIPQWDLNPEVAVAHGGAVAASVLCSRHFKETLLERLNPENLAVFTENLSVSNMVVRKLVMPDGKESKDLFHGCMQNYTLVAKNVSIIILVLHDNVVNKLQTTLPFVSDPFFMESYCGADEIIFELYTGTDPTPW
jgi:hypothetical protein